MITTGRPATKNHTGSSDNTITITAATAAAKQGSESVDASAADVAKLQSSAMGQSVSFASETSPTPVRNFSIPTIGPAPKIMPKPLVASRRQGAASHASDFLNLPGAFNPGCEDKDLLNRVQGVYGSGFQGSFGVARRVSGRRGVQQPLDPNIRR